MGTFSGKFCNAGKMGKQPWLPECNPVERTRFHLSTIKNVFGGYGVQ
jgi:hypothetical protein